MILPIIANNKYIVIITTMLFEALYYLTISNLIECKRDVM